MKKSIYRIVLFTLIAFSLVYACAPKVEVETAPTSLGSTVLSIEYSDAANLRSQLAYGTIKLADTPNAVTPEQAKSMIPLWQAVISLSGDTTTAAEELTACSSRCSCQAENCPHCSAVIRGRTSGQFDHFCIMPTIHVDGRDFRGCHLFERLRINQIHDRRPLAFPMISI